MGKFLGSNGQLKSRLKRERFSVHHAGDKRDAMGWAITAPVAKKQIAVFLAGIAMHHSGALAFIFLILWIFVNLQRVSFLQHKRVVGGGVCLLCPIILNLFSLF